MPPIISFALLSFRFFLLFHILQLGPRDRYFHKVQGHPYQQEPFHLTISDRAVSFVTRRKFAEGHPLTPDSLTQRCQLHLQAFPRTLFAVKTRS